MELPEDNIERINLVTSWFEAMDIYPMDVIRELQENIHLLEPAQAIKEEEAWRTFPVDLPIDVKKQITLIRKTRKLPLPGEVLVNMEIL